MKTLLPLLVLLYATAAYAGRQAQVDVPDNSPVNVTISPTSKPSTTPSAQVVFQPSAWAPVRDGIILALVGILPVLAGVIVAWLRSIGRRLQAAESNASTGLAAGQAAHSVAAEANKTANQALEAKMPGGRRASDPPATIPKPADPLGTLPVFRQRDEGLKP